MNTHTEPRRRGIIFMLAGLLVVFSLSCAGFADVFEEFADSLDEPTATIQPTPVPPTPVSTLAPVPLDEGVRDLQSQVEAVYTMTGNSVVNIAVTSIGYDFFLNPVPQEGSGSGFVYDSDGHIVTNYHVIEGAEKIGVTFADGTTVVAEVVGEDPTYDLAVVRVDPATVTLVPVVLGDSEALRIGQFVVAIGAPFGLDQTVTFGVISSLGRVIQSPDNRFIGEAIQTDAAINPGNSGGPLLDLEGRVIGVNAQIISPSQASAGIGFAIPVRLVKQVVPELIATGTYRHPWMGIAPASMTPQLAEIMREVGYDVPDQGVYVVTVESGSGADRAGLRGAQREVRTNWGRVPVGGDVIVALDGTSVEAASDLIAYLETFTQPGDAVEVTYVRDGEQGVVNVVLGER